MQISIRTILSLQLVLVLACAVGVFLYTIHIEERSISESVEHGEDAVSTCFDQYMTSIETIGEEFITDISHQLTNHVSDVVDYAESKARAAITTVERTGYMNAMETNDWHGGQMLPSLGWMILGPLEDATNADDAVVEDIVIASLNSTEEHNNWVWFGKSPRNPNRDLACDFYYYRNATNASSSLWCLEDLYEEPGAPSPSIYPHLYSPAIVKLQNATPCDVAVEVGEKRPLVWMPLNFFVWTHNVVALTSVVGSVFGPDGTCQGLAAANVKFTSMSKYLTNLVNSARYDNLSIALIESTSGTILGTSLGDAIYTENQTRSDGTTVEQELPATLAQMDNSLALAMNQHIEESYGGIDQIPTPFITSATLEDQEYFLSFETFSRPMLNITIVAFLPHVSITGPIEAQKLNSELAYENSSELMAERMNRRFLLAIGIGAGGLLAVALIASLTSAYLSVRVRGLVKFMDKLRGKISDLVNNDTEQSRGSSTDILCEKLPPDFFPVFGTSKIADLNKIGGATQELCAQLQHTWDENKEVFRKALEQRQFTASIAHDIRNPLHGVLGIVSMMQSDIDSHKDKLPLLADTLAHMAVLLNDMVDLSKIQGGKVTHVLKKFDAWNTVNEVHTLYQSAVASGGGELSRVNLDPSPLPQAISDPVHVQRILTNFVTNASKYAKGSKIMLKTNVVTRDQVQNHSFLRNLDSHLSDTAPYWIKNATLEHDQYIVLACLDKGRGIPASKLDNVFEAYQQTRDSDRFQGAGLGLAIAKGLAVDMGGGIGVQAEEGRGSLFWLVVPCLPKQPLKESAPNKSEDSKAAATIRKSTSINDFAGSHVLVIDDTKLNLMLLKHFLKRLEIVPDTSLDAMDGLAKLQAEPDKYKLIISDFNMPEMSGGELCLEVRKDPKLCHLPFICSSGNHLTDEEKELYKIDDTLMKPFTIDQLKTIVKQYIYKTSMWCPNKKSSSTTTACVHGTDGTDKTASDSSDTW